ncbi:MAG: cysteine desulfurase [Candidatus Kerfeldbacteria bacterium]|nr:cysteine desulfurase [Candidatus Kerfeldbacteria bacterium]
MSEQQRRIYLDHAATTPLAPEVFSAMEPWLREEYANPSSAHTPGYRARRAIDDARTTIARFLHCSPQELVFTAGGTESINMALLGAARHLGRGHIVTTAIEHPAVLDTCRALEREGFELTIVPVAPNGIVNPQQFVAAVKETTILVSMMMVNNEIGTIQPVTETVQLVKAVNSKILFHTDACQATESQPLDMGKLGVDLLSINASKVYGPKGVGALYVKRGVTLRPLLYGGHQEHGLRPGTENVAGIVGFAAALQLVHAEQQQENMRLTQLRDRLMDAILSAIPHSRLNGDRTRRVPNNLNVFIPEVDGEALLLHLDQEGIAASLGSACTAGSLEPSHVLLALGYARQDARRSLRLTLGRSTTIEDVDYVVRALAKIVQK